MTKNNDISTKKGRCKEINGIVSKNTKTAYNGHQHGNAHYDVREMKRAPVGQSTKLQDKYGGPFSGDKSMVGRRLPCCRAE